MRKKILILIEVDINTGLPTGKWENAGDFSGKQKDIPSTNPYDESGYTQCGVLCLSELGIDSAIRRHIGQDTETGKWFWKFLPYTYSIESLIEGTQVYEMDYGLAIDQPDGTNTPIYHIYTDGRVFDANNRQVSDYLATRIKVKVINAFPSYSSHPGLLL